MDVVWSSFLTLFVRVDWGTSKQILYALLYILSILSIYLLDSFSILYATHAYVAIGSAHAVHTLYFWIAEMFDLYYLSFFNLCILASSFFITFLHYVCILVLFL